MGLRRSAPTAAATAASIIPAIPVITLLIALMVGVAWAVAAKDPLNIPLNDRPNGRVVYAQSGPVPVEPVLSQPSLEPKATVSSTSRQPGAMAGYTVKFTTDRELVPPQDGIVLTLHEDIGIPGRIDPTAVTVHADLVAAQDGAGTVLGGGGGPAMVVALKRQADPRKPTTLTVYPGDLHSREGMEKIVAGAQITLALGREAFLTNPRQGGAFSWTVRTTVQEADEAVVAAHPDPKVRQAFGEPESPTTPEERVTGLLVDRQIQLSRQKAKRGTEIVAIARGYKNDTTLTFWRDANFNGQRDPAEVDLCNVLAEGNNMGVCSFFPSNPPFAPIKGDCGWPRPIPDGSSEPTPGNCNLVNVIDGLGQTITLVMDGPDSVVEADSVLELEGTVKALTAGLPAPGRLTLVQLADFPEGQLTAVDLAGQSVEFLPGAVGGQGHLQFNVSLPDQAHRGRQVLRVEVTRKDNGEIYAGQTILRVEEALVVANPVEVRANQRVHLTGSGFSGLGPGAGIERISIGGRDIDPRRIGGGLGQIGIDRGGSWTAAVDLPFNQSTIVPGSKEILVQDHRGRVGRALIYAPPRQVTVAPLWGGPGSSAIVRGSNFPVRNDGGSSVNLVIRYVTEGAQTLTNATPDFNGDFEAEIRVPHNISIPSTNTVRVEFVDDDGTLNSTLATHDVPGAAVALSPDQGPPGLKITASGQGFKPFATITRVAVGGIEITPLPPPTVDRNGRVELGLVIPGIGSGQHTVSVEAASIVANAPLKIIPGAGLEPATPVAAAAAALGDNFVRSFHFDNAAKVWTFYDPAAAEASDQTHFIPGESYWLLVRKTASVSLNGRTRQLSCLDGNCQNQIIW